jgi:hypothetical protein
MKISTSALTGVLAAAVMALGVSASNASITFGIKASTLTEPGTVDSFAPEAVFGTDFGVGLVGATFSIISPNPPGSPSSVPSQYKSPWSDDINVADLPSATYFSIGGPNPTPQTVTFSEQVTGLTVLLGSIDDYNFFEFNNDPSTEITGTDIANAVSATAGGQSVNFGTTSAVIRFQGPITSFTVSSNNAAAEFAVAAVPLPAAGFLMLAGLGGLVASRKLRRRADA